MMLKGYPPHTAVFASTHTDSDAGRKLPMILEDQAAVTQ
jgi:hypothetical protein